SSSKQPGDGGPLLQRSNSPIRGRGRGRERGRRGAFAVVVQFDCRARRKECCAETTRHLVAYNPRKMYHYPSSSSSSFSCSSSKWGGWSNGVLVLETIP